MSAELLREAAALMRERAEAASTDAARTPWGDENLKPYPMSDWSSEMKGYLGGPLGEQAASWHPAVALAVADWLELAADNADHWLGLAEDSPAFVVARTYLGRPVAGT